MNLHRCGDDGVQSSPGSADIVRRRDFGERCVGIERAAPWIGEEIADGAAFPGGFVHLPRGTEAEWVKQLAGEQLMTVKTKRGFTRLEWQKVRERNEALDCRVYARAAAWIAGADRWSEAKWRDLEEQVGPDPGDRGRAFPQVEKPNAGVVAPRPSTGGARRSDWLAVDKGWLS